MHLEKKKNCLMSIMNKVEQTEKEKQKKKNVTGNDWNE